MPQVNRKQRKEEDDEDEDDFDYEDRVFSVMKARGRRLDSFENTNFNHKDPGLPEVRYLFLLFAIDTIEHTCVHICAGYVADAASSLNGPCPSD